MEEVKISRQQCSKYSGNDSKNIQKFPKATQEKEKQKQIKATVAWKKKIKK